MSEKIMLIDGNSIVNRAFYGVPLLSNAEGKYTNAVYGFLNILLKLLEEEEPTYVAVAFDLPTPTFRHQSYAEYKAGRKSMPQELREQIPLLKEMLTAMQICQYTAEGYEADDILGTLSLLAEQQGMIPVVVSGDRDLLQLADDVLKVRIPKTKGGRTETEDYYAADVVKKYGVTPQEFIQMKALMGDASDHIPGVPGIGEKTAAKIIQEYHDVETAIAHADQIKPKKAAENLAAYADQARMSLFLAKIVRDVPIALDPSCMGITHIYSDEAYQLAKKLEFRNFLLKFEKKATVEPAENKYQRITDTAAAKAFFASLPNGETAYILYEENEQVAALALYHRTTGGVLLEVNEKLSQASLFEVSAKFFESAQHQKIGIDVKREIHCLRKNGIDPSKVVFDAAIAAYLLNPLKNSYSFDTISSDFLGETLPTQEEILGKGKSRKSIFSLSEAERTSFLVKQAEVIYRAKPIMLEKLQEEDQLMLFEEIEMPLIYVLADMEEFGISVDKEKILEYQEMLRKDIEAVTEEIYALSETPFNLNSPKQLGEVLFEKMGLKGGKKTKTGYSTAADVLEKLKGDHPIIEKILYYRQLSKLKSTYADGLLSVMDEKTEKIYSTFHQTITATGRISSSEPNLQNIPIRLELGRQLRKVFVPQNEQYCFLDADYSQIELRVLAHISGDETLIEAFRTGQDIHRLTASQVFHVPFDEVTPLQRSNAKAVNFGIVYGIGAFSLSQDLGITKKEAERYMEGYFAKYPKIKTYMQETIRKATEDGYVSTMWHRRRPMPELQSNQFMQRAFGERVAMNMPIQGSAADIIKIAMVKVHRALKEGGFRSKLILQVHDELLVETYLPEKEAVERILKENMEQAAQMAVPLEVDVHAGKSWFEAK